MKPFTNRTHSKAVPHTHASGTALPARPRPSPRRTCIGPLRMQPLHAPPCVTSTPPRRLYLSRSRRHPMYRRPPPSTRMTPSLDLASARIILSGPAPPPSADARVATRGLASPHRRQEQALFDNVGVDAVTLIFSNSENVLLPAPGSCTVVLQFTPHNCLKSLQTFMVKPASERGMTCPQFFAVDSFFLCAFLLFCHYEDSAANLTLLSLLLSPLNGVSVLTDDISTLTKPAPTSAAQLSSVRPSLGRSAVRRHSPIASERQSWSNVATARHRSRRTAPFSAASKSPTGIICGCHDQAHRGRHREAASCCRRRR